MTEQQQKNTNGLPLDRADSRMSHNHSVGDYLKDFIQKIKAGDLGSLPVVVGLIIICTVFSIVNQFIV